MYASGQKGKKARVRREVGDIANVAGLASLAAWPVVFGHTRHATTGAVTRENQHPFRVGNVLLAHNGMIWNHEELNRKYSRKCVVDSQHFAHHIADDLTFSDIEAYGSLEWVEDKHPGTVYLCRMAGGVLSVAGIKNRKGKQAGTAWSSDKDHLRRALEASRLDFFWYDGLNEGQVYEVTAGVMYSSRRPALRLAESKVDRKALRRAMRVTSGYSDSWGDAEGGWWDRHYPRRDSSRTYTWDSRVGAIVPTSHNHLDRDQDSPVLTRRENTRPDLTVVGAGEDEEDALWDATLRRAGLTSDGKLLSDDGAGAPAHRDEDEDYDAEAQRLGLIKLDEGMWSVPETGALVDRDGIDDLLDAEEDEVAAVELQDLTESESELSDAEEEAWKRTVATAIAAKDVN